MRHGISEEEWDDHLLGKSAPGARVRIDAHLLSCPKCWERYQREYSTTNTLEAGAAQARELLNMDDQRLPAMFAEIMGKIRAQGLTPGSEISQSLDSLKAVLEPVFGPTAAQRAMHLAASDSSSVPLNRITHENWNSFLEKLSAIVSIICGDIFAGVIWEHGYIAPAAL